MSINNLFLTSLRITNAWIKLYSDYTNLITIYSKVTNKTYHASLNELKKTNKPNKKSLYEMWLELTAKTFEKELRSPEFTLRLSDFVNSTVELRSAYRDIGFSVDYFDRVFDKLTRNIIITMFSSTNIELSNTPFDVVFTLKNVRVLHYKNEKTNNNTKDSKKNTVPLLVVYAPINRYHIMDLSPKKSVIRNLLSRGLDVYLIDWGYPSWNDDDLSLEDYIEYVNHAVELIKNRSKVKEVSILGYCWGGIISLIYTSIYKDSVEKLAVMASPVDTTKDNSMLSVWIKSIDSNKMIKEFRHMDGQLLDMGFVMRNPAKYAFDKYLKFYQKISDKDYVDTFLAVEKWLYNTPSIPTKLYTQIIEGCYKNNLLFQNKMNINNKEINLGTVSVPILIITAKDDDLVSPESTIALKEILTNAPKISTLQIPGGHVGLCISSKAHKYLWPQTSEWFLKNN